MDEWLSWRIIVWMNVCVCGWVGGWMDGWMGEWVGGWVDGQRDGQGEDDPAVGHHVGRHPPQSRAAHDPRPTPRAQVHLPT